MRSIQTRIIQKLIELNESVFFYPKLKSFYKKELLKKKVHILDVGANKGQSIDFFLSINPNCSIYAFEANHRLTKFLMAKYKSNKKIEIFNKGVSQQSGELLFRENILDETSTFEVLNFESKYLKKKAKILNVSFDDLVVSEYKVNTISLSEFLVQKPDVVFDVLKIDVEGHELKCLRGLFVSQSYSIPIRFIQLELHYDDMYQNPQSFNEINNLMLENNFEIRKKIRHGFGDFEEIIYKNKKYL